MWLVIVNFTGGGKIPFQVKALDKTVAFAKIFNTLDKPLQQSFISYEAIYIYKDIEKIA